MLGSLCRDLELLDGRTQSLGEPAGTLVLDSASQDYELFSAEARKNVFQPNHAGYEPGHFTQDRVPGEMPVAVVDPLEVIEVEEHER